MKKKISHIAHENSNFGAVSVVKLTHVTKILIKNRNKVHFVRICESASSIQWVLENLPPVSSQFGLFKLERLHLFPKASFSVLIIAVAANALATAP